MLPENESYKYYKPLHDKVSEYCDKRLDSFVTAKLRRFAILNKDYPFVVSENVCTPAPDCLEATVIYNITGKPGSKSRPRNFYNAYVYMHLGDPDHPSFAVHSSNMWMETADKDIKQANSKLVVVLHAHAIDRYIERHKYTGTRRSCEDYLLFSLVRLASRLNFLDNEILIPFDGGTFIGNYKDGVMHYRTFVMNSQLYTNQRLETIQIDKFAEKLYHMGIR